jgi:pectate lyase
MKTTRASFFWLPLLCLIFQGTLSAQDLCQPVGWATQNGGVTGGGNAAPVTVSNYNDLKSALTSSSNKVVYISGTINIPSGGRITIQDQSGKSIIGLPGSKLVSSDMTASGSGIFYIKRCSNFIMRNLILEGPGAYDTDGYDNLCIDACTNFWVDHCEFHDGLDGNFDIKNASDFISVTWCTFSYEKPPKSGGSGGSNDHRYSNLIGSSDGATQDEGKLNVTFYYCWWGEGVKERMPRMRFGKLHMVNSLFSSSVANNCIRAGYKANILAEGNYFDNQKKPIDEYDKDYTAIRAVNNYGASDLIKNTAFTPPYSITVANPTTIVTPIKNCAGATLSDPTGCSSCGGGQVNQPPSVSITSPANNASFNAPATITINANASDPDGNVSKVEFYNGNTLLGTDNSSPYSYTWSNVAAGTYTITAKATDNKNASKTSSEITIIVNDPSVPSLTATSNTTQAVDSGSAITPIVFTWGGAATDVNYTSLPGGLTASKNSSAKTLTISGTPTQNGSFSVSTVGGNSSVTLNASITLKVPGSILADWYPFQENPVTLRFLSFSNATLDISFYDDSKPSNGVTYTSGALRLNKGDGVMRLELKSLDVLKIRWYATGGRTLRVTYGATGTENIWNSPEQYQSGAHEFDLTSMIPGLVSATPIIVNIINNRSDGGGNLNIHDLYVEGSVHGYTNIGSIDMRQLRNSSFSFKVTGNSLVLTGNNSKQSAVIMDVLGKTVLASNSRRINISSLNNGIYILKIGNFTGRFIKK